MEPLQGGGRKDGVGRYEGKRERRKKKGLKDGGSYSSCRWYGCLVKEDALPGKGRTTKGALMKEVAKKRKDHRSLLARKGERNRETVAT